jgi:hypothetical protein
MTTYAESEFNQAEVDSPEMREAQGKGPVDPAAGWGIEPGKPPAGEGSKSLIPSVAKGGKGSGRYAAGSGAHPSGGSGHHDEGPQVGRTSEHATAGDFKNWEERAHQMSDEALRSSITDARNAARSADTIPGNGAYAGRKADEASTYQQELTRRQSGKDTAATGRRDAAAKHESAGAATNAARTASEKANAATTAARNSSNRDDQKRLSAEAYNQHMNAEKAHREAAHSNFDNIRGGKGESQGRAHHQAAESHRTAAQAHYRDAFHKK